MSAPIDTSIATIALVSPTSPSSKQLVRTARTLHQAQRRSVKMGCICGKSKAERLFIASRDNETEMVRQILNKRKVRPKDLQWRDKDGWTSLHFSCYRGNVETTDLLIKAGADVLYKDNLGRTPLHFAKSKRVCKNKELVELIMSRARTRHHLLHASRVLKIHFTLPLAPGWGPKGNYKKQNKNFLHVCARERETTFCRVLSQYDDHKFFHSRDLYCRRNDYLG